MNHNDYLKQELLSETKLARIYKFIEEGRPFAMLTAFRGDKTVAENNKRNKKLESDLRSAGYGYSKMKGAYVEDYGTDDAKDVSEASFFVIGNSPDDKEMKDVIVKLGKKYEQDSVFFKPVGKDNGMLIGTNNSDFPGMGKEIDVGKWKPNKAGEFYSKMKGRSFVFESVKSTPQNWLGRWSEKKQQEAESLIEATAGDFKEYGIKFPNVKGWQITFIDEEDSDEVSDTVSYSKDGVTIDFYYLDHPKHEYRISGYNDKSARDGATSSYSYESIRGNWNTANDIKKVISDFEKGNAK